jgi:hypothetical protein
MKVRTWSLLAFTAVALTGCQSMQVRTDYDHKVVFNKLRSYCWAAPPAFLYNDPRLKMDLLEPLVREDVEQRLASRGYVSTDCPNADFRVSFRAALQDQVVEGRSDNGEGGGLTIYEWSPETGGRLWTSSSDETVNVEREGSLIVLILSPKTDRVLWRGSVSANLRSQVSPQQRKERLAKAIQMVMEKFPPPPTK